MHPSGRICYWVKISLALPKTYHPEPEQKSKPPVSLEYQQRVNAAGFQAVLKLWTKFVFAFLHTTTLRVLDLTLI